MKKFILVGLLIAVALGFVFKDLKPKNIESNTEAPVLNACTSNETNALYSAIGSC
jgi:hypothetical protein